MMAKRCLLLGRESIYGSKYQDIEVNGKRERPCFMGPTEDE